MSALSEAVKGPEFWMSVAFVLLVVASFSPVQRFLTAWGAKRAKGVQDEINRASILLAEAEDLLTRYEGHTQNRLAEKDALIAEGENTVRQMQEEMDYALKSRIEQKKKDTTDKIDLMHKTVRQNVKKEILTKVIQKTTVALQAKAGTETQADVDAALERAFAALEVRLKAK